MAVYGIYFYDRPVEEIEDKKKYIGRTDFYTETDQVKKLAEYFDKNLSKGVGFLVEKTEFRSDQVTEYIDPATL